MSDLSKQNRDQDKALLIDSCCLALFYVITTFDDSVIKFFEFIGFFYVQKGVEWLVM